MKKAIFVVINKAMKITLKERIATFLNQRNAQRPLSFQFY